MKKKKYIYIQVYNSFLKLNKFYFVCLSILVISSSSIKYVYIVGRGNYSYTATFIIYNVYIGNIIEYWNL